MRRVEILRFFDVPEYLDNYTDLVMSEEDWKFVEAGGSDRMLDTGGFTQEEIDNAYRRGVINKVRTEDGIRYKVGFFMRRIDCCMRGEREFWNSIPQDIKEKYIYLMQDVKKWLIDEPDDIIVEVLPIEDALKKFDDVTGTIFIQECDCRVYLGACGKPTDVCVHFPDDLINTAYDRGYAKEVTKEEAIAAMYKADKAGLVHCFGRKDFCNCCGDCCWSLRARDTVVRDYGFDMKHKKYNCSYIMAVHYEKCKNCGACAKLCPVGALKKGYDHIEIDSEKCWGCGVCRTKCRFDALEIVKYR